MNKSIEVYIKTVNKAANFQMRREFILRFLKKSSIMDDYISEMNEINNQMQDIILYEMGLLSADNNDKLFILKDLSSSIYKQSATLVFLTYNLLWYFRQLTPADKPLIYNISYMDMNKMISDAYLFKHKKLLTSDAHLSYERLSYIEFELSSYMIEISGRCFQYAWESYKCETAMSHFADLKTKKTTELLSCYNRLKQYESDSKEITEQISIERRAENILGCSLLKMELSLAVKRTLTERRSIKALEEEIDKIQHTLEELYPRVRLYQLLAADSYKIIYQSLKILNYYNIIMDQLKKKYDNILHIQCYGESLIDDLQYNLSYGRHIDSIAKR